MSVNHIKNILGIITARADSKRVPRKNIRNFLGKPLLAWSIETGLESGVFDRLILSTEDEEIAEIGRRYGIETPFLRPVELATDTATSSDVLKHAAVWLKNHENYETPWIILLEPTSPGRRSFHIQEVAKIIRELNDFDSLAGISEMPARFSYLKELQMDERQFVARVGDGATFRKLIQRNQDVLKTYFHNSAIYALRTANLFNPDTGFSLWGDRTYGYLMDIKYAMDIDTLDDWVIAEAKMERILKEEDWK